MDKIYIKIGLISGVVKKKATDLFRTKTNKEQVLGIVEALKNAADFPSVGIIEIWVDSDKSMKNKPIYYIWTPAGETVEPVSEDVLVGVRSEFADAWKWTPEGWAEQIPEVNFDLTIMAFDELSSSYLELSTKALAERITEIFLENSYDLGEDDMDFPYAKYARRLAKKLKS